MGNGQSVADVFNVQGSNLECGSEDLTLSVLSARTIADNEVVTVLYYQSSSKYREVLINCLKFTRVLRHPRLVKVLSAEARSDNGKLTVVTEPACPLSVVFDSGASFYADEVAWHLSGLLEAVTFLHNADYSHNNIGEHCIFVVADGTWKLGRLESVQPLLAKGGAGSGGLEYLAKVAPLVSAGRVPGDGGPPGVCNDVYGISQLFNRLKDRLSDLGSAKVDDFAERINEVLQKGGSSQQPALSALKGHAIFRTDFQEIAAFLSEITAKSESTKVAFFNSLLPRLRALPPDLVARCLVKRLLTRFVVLDETARRHVLPALLTPNWKSHERSRADQLAVVHHCTCHVCAVEGLLPLEEFGSSVLVIVLKLFRIRDIQARVLLLEHFHSYCVLFDVSCLRRLVMPQVVRSLQDSSDVVVSLALRALADMVPLLGGEAVIGSPREKLFYDGSPTLVARVASESTKPHGISSAMPLVPSTGAVTSSSTNVQIASDASLRETTGHSSLCYDNGSHQSGGHGGMRVIKPECSRSVNPLLAAAGQSSAGQSHGQPGRDEASLLGRQPLDTEPTNDGLHSGPASRTNPRPASQPHELADYSLGTGKLNDKVRDKINSEMKDKLNGEVEDKLASKVKDKQKASNVEAPRQANTPALTRDRPLSEMDFLDIKSMVIKSRPLDTEVDYFADMAPSLASAAALPSVTLALPHSTEGAAVAYADAKGSSVVSWKHNEKFTMVQHNDEVSEWSDSESWPDSGW